MGLVENIRALCEKQKYPITRLEHDVGFSQGTIRRWENIVPGVDKVIKIADALDVPLDELCGRSFDDQTVAGLYEYAREMNTLSEQENLLVLSFRTLSDADKLAIMSLILKMRLKKEDDKNE